MALNSMLDVLYDFRENYNAFWNSGDERTMKWPLMSSPIPTIVICLSYVYFVKVLGPKLMADRKPLEIRWLMVAYNFFMVGVSWYLFWRLGQYGWFGKYNYRCQPVDYSKTGEAMAMAHLAWWFYISKFVEFCDTLFFVARKKFSHISALHVIHHGIMPMSVWWGVKFTPGGHSTFFAFINSFVHILMYVYYGLAAIGPHMTKYLWWKKYMTMIQMVQFLMIFVHSFQLLFRECNYPRGFMWWIGFHAVLFWFLFYDFYVNTYERRRRSRMATAVGSSSSTQATNGQINGKIHANGDSCHVRNGETARQATMCSLNYNALFDKSDAHKNENEVCLKNGVCHENGFHVKRRTACKSSDAEDSPTTRTDL